MNDYKELIYALKSCQHIASDCIDCPLSNTKYYNPKTKECEVHLHNIAADAIEQLVRERDEFAKTSKQFEKKCKQLECERDAAVADLAKPMDACKSCKNRFEFGGNPINCLNCNYTSGVHSKFEWRGVEGKHE